jgi:ribose transport system permease protein
MKSFINDHGLGLALLLLCIVVSVMTFEHQHPNDADAAARLARTILASANDAPNVLIAVRANDEDRLFADALRTALEQGGAHVMQTVQGSPGDARRALKALHDQATPLHVIACNVVTANWGIFANLPTQFPQLGNPRVVVPTSYRWPNFLKRTNLINVTDQIAVIAMVAIGMTMVIMTGGIDLSVGSLIALSAVITARCIRDLAGAEEATTTGLVLCSVLGISACGGFGLISGLLVTTLRIPAFIVSLAFMLVARGLADIVSERQAIDQVPSAFSWLGRGTSLGRIPNSVILMLSLYAVAFIVMHRMAIGRYIYAVGGNREAARLSGVPIHRVHLFVYGVCGALAGLGGVVMASQLESGAPQFGDQYELKAIAAVVVGGTSLTGGGGQILGTLLGALFVAVIENGMNLRGVNSDLQKVVLGLVILAAVVLDRKRHQG